MPHTCLWRLARCLLQGKEHPQTGQAFPRRCDLLRAPPTHLQMHQPGAAPEFRTAPLGDEPLCKAVSKMARRPLTSHGGDSSHGNVAFRAALGGFRQWRGPLVLGASFHPFQRAQGRPWHDSTPWRARVSRFRGSSPKPEHTPGAQAGRRDGSNCMEWQLEEFSARGREVERETGLEPATNGLEGRDSTLELLPLLAVCALPTRF